VLIDAIIKCEFVMKHQFSGFTLQKQAILQETQLFFATLGLAQPVRVTNAVFIIFIR